MPKTGESNMRVFLTVEAVQNRNRLKALIRRNFKGESMADSHSAIFQQASLTAQKTRRQKNASEQSIRREAPPREKQKTMQATFATLFLFVMIYVSLQRLILAMATKTALRMSPSNKNVFFCSVWSATKMLASHRTALRTMTYPGRKANWCSHIQLLLMKYLLSMLSAELSQMSLLKSKSVLSSRKNLPSFLM